MIVVSDTSAVTSLAAIGRLDLLRCLYGSVVIPQSVFEELTGLPNQPGGAEVESLDWISHRPASDRSLVTSLLANLDSGEAEAIALAVELRADLLLMDERLGRAVAERFGLKLVGTLGVLLAAKQQRFLTSVKPVLDDLIAKARFRIGGTLYQAILDAAGETY